LSVLDAHRNGIVEKMGFITCQEPVLPTVGTSWSNNRRQRKGTQNVV